MGVFKFVDAFYSSNVRESFHVFGPVHLAVLAMIPLMGVALAAAQRQFPRRSREFRYGLAVLLLACTSWYYGSFVAHGERLFPSHMPLELCDLSLWLAIYTLLSVRTAAFDVAYYWAVAGGGMALLTPNLVRPTVVDEVQFFANHGMVVIAVLYLVWSGQVRPRRGSVWRALIAVNIAAVFVGAFDYVFKTDYMFLCTKPPTVSLLDVFGPWPWYIVACEGAAVVLFGLLYWPFWGRARESLV